MKLRLIYDLCNPTRDRRPTTEDDIDDVIIEEFDNLEDCWETLCDLMDFDEDDLEYELDMGADAEPEDKIKVLLDSPIDPGDGSPNIQYLSVNGKEWDLPGICAYDCFENLDLENCSLKELREAWLEEFAEEDEDDWWLGEADEED